MDKVILLKTQLIEAARFGKSNDYRIQRLAVILLDNFVEIQLSSLIKIKFWRDGVFAFLDKKYKHNERKVILSRYDELLKTCAKENIITQEEKTLLSFCHNVRNNLYHNIEEEKLLVLTSLIILHKVITEKQPHWKNARIITAHNNKFKDTFLSKKSQTNPINSNSEEEWKYFLNKYFDFIDKRKSSAQKLLSNNILLKMKETKKCHYFLKKNLQIHYPRRKPYDFNEYLFEYSFTNIKHNEIELIKESGCSIKEMKAKLENLKNEYKKGWKQKNLKRIKEIEVKAQKIATLNIFKSLEIYNSLRDEVEMIHEAFMHAASDLDNSIQLAYDSLRGK